MNIILPKTAQPWVLEDEYIDQTKEETDVIAGAVSLEALFVKVKDRETWR